MPDNRTLSKTDQELINKTICRVQEMRRDGVSCKTSITLDCGCEAVIYHMGKGNPVIRIHLRFKEE